NLRLCPTTEFNPTLAWKLGPLSRSVVDRVVLEEPPLKATPETMKVLFMTTQIVSDEDLRQMESEGAEGRMRAREAGQRNDFIIRELGKIDPQYYELFGKQAYGVGFGHRDMLGRTLALNLCHNAVRDGIMLIEKELHGPR